MMAPLGIGYKFLPSGGSTWISYKLGHQGATLLSIENLVSINLLLRYEMVNLELVNVEYNLSIGSCVSRTAAYSDKRVATS